MAKIKTKDLKDQYLFRVYDENESELLHRAITKFKDKLWVCWTLCDISLCKIKARL